MQNEYKVGDIIHMKYEFKEVAYIRERERAVINLMYSNIIARPSFLQFIDLVDEKKETYNPGDIIHIPFKIESWTDSIVELRNIAMFMNLYTEKFLEIISHYNS